jgi:hypothetical protein
LHDLSVQAEYRSELFYYGKIGKWQIIFTGRPQDTQPQAEQTLTMHAFEDATVMTLTRFA